MALANHLASTKNRPIVTIAPSLRSRATVASGIPVSAMHHAWLDAALGGCFLLAPFMAKAIFPRSLIKVAQYFEMIVLIDNYDSFTYNLVHYLGELGAEVEVRRNDVVTPEQVLAMSPDAIVLSPGPCDPDKAGICLNLVEKAAGTVPILGVCLGHQTIGQVFGGKVVRAPEMMHGKVSQVFHHGDRLYEDIPSPFAATRYHSLIIGRDSVPDCLEITAETEDGIVMGLRHRQLPVHGVQVHPESIASQYGHELLANFLVLAGQRVAA